MIRSLLFIPGNQPNLIQNAYLFSADAIIFDLEDAVHPSEKDNARSLVHQFLVSMKRPQSVFNLVRINALDTDLYIKDIQTLIDDDIYAFVLPKATNESINRLNQLLDQYHSSIYILPIIEEANSVIIVNEIAKMNRVIGLLLGGEDLARDLEVKRTKSSIELFYAREQVIFAAAANKILSIDTPYTDVYNDDDFEEDTRYAASLGMKAKSAIHPRHIEYINQTFSPSKEDVFYALKVIKEMKKADELKLGAFSVDGKMIDKPIIERAKKIIEKARLLKMVNENEE